ncbi:MAG: hypothetical protein ACOCP8_09880 [archaeon]
MITEILLTILLTILIILIVLMIVSTFTSLTLYSFKTYKKTYKKLDKLKYYLNYDQIYGFEEGKNEKLVIWFIKNNDFYLGNGEYLHNFFISYLSPYTLYWFLKYKKWFNKNIDLEKIQKY